MHTCRCLCDVRGGGVEREIMMNGAQCSQIHLTLADVLGAERERHRDGCYLHKESRGGAHHADFFGRKPGPLSLLHQSCLAVFVIQI